jgi:hypothetical protein
MMAEAMPCPPIRVGNVKPTPIPAQIIPLMMVVMGACYPTALLGLTTVAATLASHWGGATSRPQHSKCIGASLRSFPT